MTESLPIALICALFLLFAWQMRAFLQDRKRLEDLEQAYREREWKLLDKVLTKHGYSPLIEREQVITIPDPESKQPSWIEDAFRLDGIMEEVERYLPEARGQTPEWVRDQYPAIWMEAEAQYDVQKGNLKA